MASGCGAGLVSGHLCMSVVLAGFNLFFLLLSLKTSFSLEYLSASGQDHTVNSVTGANYRGDSLRKT